jgi:transposase-like protein
MYSPEFKEQAILKVLQRGEKTIQAIADELNINLFTLKEWLRKSRLTMTDNNTIPKRPTDWSRAQRFQALMQSSVLKGEALNGFCREQGIFSHHLDAWKADFIKETSKAETSTKSTTEKTLREENAQLKKELSRKEKALAETAALLVLQKKFQAFWEEKA